MSRDPDLKVADAAKELSTSTRQIWRLIAEGSLRSYTLGKRSRRITRQSMDAFKEANAVKPTEVR